MYCFSKNPPFQRNIFQNYNHFSKRWEIGVQKKIMKCSQQRCISNRMRLSFTEASKELPFCGLRGIIALARSTNILKIRSRIRTSVGLDRRRRRLPINLALNNHDFPISAVSRLLTVSLFQLSFFFILLRCGTTRKQKKQKNEHIPPSHCKSCVKFNAIPAPVRSQPLTNTTKHARYRKPRLNRSNKQTNKWKTKQQSNKITENEHFMENKKKHHTFDHQTHTHNHPSQCAMRHTIFHVSFSQKSKTHYPKLHQTV